MAIIRCHGKIIFNEDDTHHRYALYPCSVSGFDPKPDRKKLSTKPVMKLFIPGTVPLQEALIASRGGFEERLRLDELGFTESQITYILRTGTPIKSIDLRCPTFHRVVHALEKGTRCAAGDRLFTHSEALVSTYMPPEVMAHVQPGERARVRPLDWPSEGRNISARVAKLKLGSSAPASPFYGYNLLLRMNDAAPEYDLGTPMDIRVEVKALPDDFDVEVRRPPPPLPTLTALEMRGAAGRLKVLELERRLRQRAEEDQAEDPSASKKDE